LGRTPVGFDRGATRLDQVVVPFAVAGDVEVLLAHRDAERVGPLTVTAPQVPAFVEQVLGRVDVVLVLGVRRS